MRRKGLLLFLGTVVGALLLLGYGVALLAPAVGLYHDDAIYTVTAKALAEGRGYRIISLPIEIPQTKYPILFPFLLSLVWRAFPSFPENLPWLKLVPLVSTLVWIGLVHRLLSKETGRPRLALGISILTALSINVVFLGTTLFSDALFAALAWAALLLLRRCERDGATTLHVAGAGLLCAAALHVRTLGATLIVAGIIGLLWKRRFRRALAFALVATLLAAPWLWVSSQPIAVSDLYGYYTGSNYLDWNAFLGFSEPERWRVLALNGLLFLLAPTWLLGLSFYRLWMLLALGGVLVLVGYLRDLRRGIDSIDAFFALYVAAVLAWVWSPMRFFVPVFPLFLFHAAREGGRLLDALPRPSVRRAVVGAVVIGISLVASVRFGRQIVQVRETGLVCPRVDCGGEWRDFLDVLDWLEANVPEEAVVLSTHDGMVYLHTGRKSVGVFDADPYALIYDPPARHSLFDFTEPLETAIEESGASFIALMSVDDYVWDELVANQHRAIRTARPDLFRLAMLGSDPAFAVYRIAGSGSVEHPRDRRPPDQPASVVEDR